MALGVYNNCAGFIISLVSCGSGWAMQMPVPTLQHHTVDTLGPLVRPRQFKITSSVRLRGGKGSGAPPALPRQTKIAMRNLCLLLAEPPPPPPAPMPLARAMILISEGGGGQWLGGPCFFVPRGGSATCPGGGTNNLQHRQFFC